MAVTAIGRASVNHQTAMRTVTAAQALPACSKATVSPEALTNWSGMSQYVRKANTGPAIKAHAFLLFGMTSMSSCERGMSRSPSQ